MSRAAFVAGGASGTGLGIVRRFATDGHRVAVVDRAPAKLPSNGIDRTCGADSGLVGDTPR